MKKLHIRTFFALAAMGTAFSLQAQNWTVAGNNATASHFLGTTNTNPLVFQTNNI